MSFAHQNPVQVQWGCGHVLLCAGTCGCLNVDCFCVMYAIFGMIIICIDACIYLRMDI